MIFTPRFYIAAALAAFLFAAGFGTAWRIQNERSDAREKVHTAELLSTEKRLHAVDISRAQDVAKALNDARAADIRARDALHRANDDLDKLRGTLASTADDARAGGSACIERTDTVGELFGECAGAYLDLAAKADRHASDAKTLMQAWPKE